MKDFVMEEWKKLQYGPVIDRNTVYIPHGAKCIELENTEDGELQSEKLSQIQGHHEEADTLIVVHAKNMADGRMGVKSSDTDVLVIRPKGRHTCK